jgi:hypothetical protein
MLVDPTRELLLTKVREVFPDDDQAEILALVDRYGVEAYQREAHRVRLAILWLSKGDRDRLVKHVDYAVRDYRDVLMWAEYLSKEANEKYHAWLRGEVEIDRTGQGNDS